jgi:hypothetical protein
MKANQWRCDRQKINGRPQGVPCVFCVPKVRKQIRRRLIFECEISTFSDMKPRKPYIIGVDPTIAVPGGEIVIHCQGFKPGLPDAAKVLFGDTEAAIVSASEDRISARVPDDSKALGLALLVDGASTPVFPMLLGVQLASGLHPVTNPVIAPDGSLITTISGARGQQSQHPLIRVTRNGEATAFSCEIMNPTGLAFGPDRQLYISSRADGTVMRFSEFEHLEVVAEDLGVPCGITFDREGNLFVGDRNGKILRIDQNGKREEFASIPPSVSAFHLAMDARDALYVTGPTVAVRDPIYRISGRGKVSILADGFARPQGMTIGPDQMLWVAASYEGKKGIFRVSPRTGAVVHHIAGPMLVGLAADADDVFLADSSNLYRIALEGYSGRIS